MDWHGDHERGPAQRAGQVPAFVAAGASMSDKRPVESISIVPSRKQQRAAQSAAEQAQQQPAPSPADQRRAPSWAGAPVPGAVLQCVKDKAVIQTLPLAQSCSVFGRHETADVQLEHASISRFHAMVCFRATDGAVCVVDLGSAHGTFVAGRPCKRDQVVELKEGAELRFGASTRVYILKVPPPSRKRSVSWPDGTPPQAGKREKPNGTALETVIGYSDSAGFAVNVGPVAAKDQAEGRFAAAVKPIVREGLTRVSPAAGAHDTQQHGSRSAQQSDFKAFLESRTRKSIYDELPPPERQ